MNRVRPWHMAPLLVALAACGGSGTSGNGPGGAGPALPGSFERVFTGLSFPGMTDIRSQPDATGSPRIFVAEKTGTVAWFDPDAATPTARPYLDVSGLAGFDTAGEHGLLGIAFDPEYAVNGYVYVKLVRRDPRRVEVLRLTDDGNPPVELDTAVTVLAADDYAAQSGQTNHVGGDIAFGPVDGLLYITLGDGGGSFDPDDAAQDRSDLRGSLLRIDVAGTTGAGGSRNYTIPPANPFAGNTQGFREEILAYGLRNPFTVSIERTAGGGQRVWVADVGQNAREEVNVIRAGGNHGWDCREGTRVVEADRSSGVCAQRSDDDFVAPVIEYDHSLGRSVTGGHVYRGERLAGALTGRFVYGDFISGRIWAHDPDTGRDDELVDTDLNVVTFGEGPDGTLYFGDFRGGGLYRLAP